MKTTFVGDKYRITVLTSQLIRMEYSELGIFEDRKTQIVQNREFKPFKFNVIDEKDRLEIITEHLHLHYKKGVFSAKNLFVDVKDNLSDYGGRWYFGEVYETLKGTAKTLDFANGEIPLGDGIISKNGFATLDDSASFIMLDNGDFEMRKADEIDLYFFGYGRNYFKALKDFYTLTGPVPLIPRYALGNWWSRFWSYSEEEYISLMDRFSSENVPLSVSVIDMDWHLTNIPQKYGSGWTGYTWNKHLFPKPQRFLEELKKRGLHTTLNVHPADGIRPFEDCYPAVAKSLNLNQDLEEPAIFDIANSSFRKTYFENVHHPLEKQGVDFWWIDWQQGIKQTDSTVMDPLWLLNYYHYQDINRNKENNIILSRYAGPGSHRYPVGFSGDTIITWESLAFQPYFTNTAANIGYTWWSHDIGGHMHGYYDEELSLRWIQYGVFSPINRLHSSKSPFSSKEPWHYSSSIKQIMIRFLQLRHKLLPYLYTLNVCTHEMGCPINTPMYYYYPLEDESYNVPNQFFLGSELMVAPITEKSSSIYKTAKVDVWFPEGDWYDFFTDVKYEGGTKISVYRTSEEYPVFVKAGAIIPLAELQNLIGTDLPETVNWHIFSGKSNSFELIEDQGVERIKTKIILDWDQSTIKINVIGDVSILPKKRNHKIIFHNFDKKVQVINPENLKVEVSYGSLKEKNSVLYERLFNLLDRAEISYDLKNDLLNKLSTGVEMKKIDSILNNLPNELHKRLFEIFYTTN